MRMDSPPSTQQRSEKKKLSKAQQLKEESEKFLQRPSIQIANPNKDLKQSYEKGFFKDKRFDHFRYLKKIRSKAEKDSVSSEIDDDEEFSIKTHRKNSKKQISDGDKSQKKRGRKPKNEQEKAVEVPKKQPILQQLHDETQVVKKRGRPKGSVNKNKKQNEKKQQQKKMKQFECLKKIEPTQKEASSLQDESQSQSHQADQKVQRKQVIEKNDQSKLNKSNEEKKNINEDQESQEQEDGSGTQQQSKDQDSKEEQKDNKHSNMQESQEASQDESQEQFQNQNIVVPPKPQQKKQQKINLSIINNGSNKVQRIAPLRGKKLAINSPSPSENQQIIKNKKEDKKPILSGQSNNPKEVDQQNLIANNDLLPQQQQLNKLIKKRGRKSHETQLQIQRLKQIIYQKKNNALVFENNKQKIDQHIPQIQANKDKSQSYHKESNHIMKKPRIVSSMYQSKRNQEKPAQNKSKISPIISPKPQQIVIKKTQQRVQNLIDRKQIQKEIMERKIKKLTMQSKIYCEEINLEEPIDPEQQKLFRKWTKYYKKFNQALVSQEQSDQAQHSANKRKEAPKHKIKRYRKVIIQEPCDDISEEQHIIKKIRKQKRKKQPRKIFLEKKSKSKQKKHDSSSSDSD